MPVAITARGDYATQNLFQRWFVAFLIQPSVHPYAISHVVVLVVQRYLHALVRTDETLLSHSLIHLAPKPRVISIPHIAPPTPRVVRAHIQNLPQTIFVLGYHGELALRRVTGRIHHQHRRARLGGHRRHPVNWRHRVPHGGVAFAFAGEVEHRIAPPAGGELHLDGLIKFRLRAADRGALELHRQQIRHRRVGIG